MIGEAVLIHLDRVRCDLRVSYAVAAVLIQRDLEATDAAECAEVVEYDLSVPGISDAFKSLPLDDRSNV